MKGASNGFAAADGAAAITGEGEKKTINSELWYACAGPLLNLPPVGSLVVYFPQGHSEQVAASMQKELDYHIPNYPNLPSKLICLLHNVTLHADLETDEVYAQMTLQPVNTYEKEALHLSEIALKQSRPQTEFFCKTLTASDTSTHGGFSVPRRAAEKIFPPLDFSMQPPAQEIQARDLHDNLWTFRHIYRGQPKRHLLTTGWSLFVSGKRLVAGDSVLFIRDEKQQLLLGIRRATRQSTNNTSSVLSSDCMHIGILAAAAHAYANSSPFTVFYNPRASPSEFVIPFAKYQKAVYSNQISLGMRFRMMFETEESGTRRYMGTITGISDLDPIRWKNSQWRNLQVGWDESAVGERRNRVSIWEIEPVAAPFFICPPPYFRKRPRQPGMPDDESSEMENLFKRAMPWLGEEICIKDPQTQSTIMPGLSLVQWMNLQNPSISNSSMQSEYLRPFSSPVMQNLAAADLSRQLNMQSQFFQQNSIQFNAPKIHQQLQLDQLPKASMPASQLATFTEPQLQLPDLASQQRQQLVNQAVSLNQTQNNIIQPQVLIQAQVLQQQQQPIIPNNLPLQNSRQNQLQHSQSVLSSQQNHQKVQQLQDYQHQQPLQQQQEREHQEVKMPAQPPIQANQQVSSSDHQIQLQFLQKLQQQQQQLQQPFSKQPTVQQHQLPQIPENTKMLHVPQQLPNSNSLAQQSLVQKQCGNPSSQVLKLPQTLPSESQQKIHPQQLLPAELPGSILPATSISNTIPAGVSSLAAGGSQSGLTDDMPSCSASPSTNHGVLPQSILNKLEHHNVLSTEKTGQSAITMLSANSFDATRANANLTKEQPRVVNNLKPVTPPKVQAQRIVTPQTYMNNIVQMDYFDTTSSATSGCLSQAGGSLQQNFTLPSFNQPSLYIDAPPDSEVQGTDPRNNVLFRGNIEGPFGLPLATDTFIGNSFDSGNPNHIPGNVVTNTNFGSSKEAQQELSSSMVSHSFGVPDITFNSIDSAINESSFLNRNSWAPAPSLQRKRTYTKVYKRGAVGRSIDITRYSGYDDLKHDLARMFSIEGQLEDWQRIGWKLVYVDLENDVLLVGDDPWEEFVNCVRCIRILSPQEVQQMSLDGDLENSLLTNQACSSSDGGNAWRGHCNQNSGNPSAGSYDR